MSSSNFGGGLSSSLKEEVMIVTTMPTTMEKQGIVSILRSDESENTNHCYYSSASNSLRRTLSADMSSKKWQSQHGFSPLKKIASSLVISNIPESSSSSSSSSDGEEETVEVEEYGSELRGQFEKWSSIQKEKEEKKQSEKIGSFDALWRSILSQKKQEDNNNNKELPPPYVHPLVKRSASTLSEKSLEICTESLGSETGSDGFSSYLPSETGGAGDIQEDQKQQQQQQQQTTRFLAFEEFEVVRYNNLAAAKRKKPSPRSFPPPIPSLSTCDGASLRMRSHRDNGSLVLEAVFVPSKNNFHTERLDGRLVLTFLSDPNQEEEPEISKDVEQFEVEIEGDCMDDKIFENKKEVEVEIEMEQNEEIEDEEIEEESGGGGEGCCHGYSEEEVSLVMEQTPNLSSGIINVHRLALMMNKPMVSANRTPTTWSHNAKFVDGKEEEEEVVVSTIAPITQSLPTRPPVGRMIPAPSVAASKTVDGGVASFNAYEHYWKPKPMKPSTLLNSITKKSSIPIESNNNSNSKFILSRNLMANEQQELIVLRGNKRDYLVPLIKSCKEEKRPLRFWEPYCIATS